MDIICCHCSMRREEVMSAAINASFCLPRSCWTKNFITSCAPRPALAVREDTGLTPRLGGGGGNPEERRRVGPTLRVSRPNDTQHQWRGGWAVVAMLLCGGGWCWRTAAEATYGRGNLRRMTTETAADGSRQWPTAAAMAADNGGEGINMVRRQDSNSYVLL
jgi:hypothetical protein